MDEMEATLKQQFLKLAEAEGVPEEIALATLDAASYLPEDLAEALAALLGGLAPAAGPAP
jgi:hypothetical protein